jgi:hypothetical protein
MRNFVYEWERINNKNVNAVRAFFDYMHDLIPTNNWQHFNFVENYTRDEKIIYLHSLGLKTLNIRKAIGGGSPNDIYKVIDEQPIKRYYQDNPALDELIEAWKPYRKLLSNEFFIRWWNH